MWRFGPVAFVAVIFGFVALVVWQSGLLDDVNAHYDIAAVQRCLAERAVYLDAGSESSVVAVFNGSHVEPTAVEVYFDLRRGGVREVERVEETLTGTKGNVGWLWSRHPSDDERRALDRCLSEETEG